MTNIPTRDFLRRQELPRRRSSRQALAVIPNSTSIIMSPGETITVELTAMDNMLNSRYGVETPSPVPSPDELVIQKRGRRRRTIVWSPDIDTCKRESLLSLSSRDRTPVKSPTKTTNMVLRSTPRKRLMLDGKESGLSTPEKRRRTFLEHSSSVESEKNFANLATGLRGLSREQLVKMIVDLVAMQESGLMPTKEKLSDVIIKNMPVADIQPLHERLSSLRQNVFASLVSSDCDSAYNRAFIHLEFFQKTLIEQGHKLVQSQHWTAVMQYVFIAWSITKELPEWESQGLENTTRKCYQALTQFCMLALRNGTFNYSALDNYKKRITVMIEDFEEFRICLNMIGEIKRCNS